MIGCVDDYLSKLTDLPELDEYKLVLCLKMHSYLICQLGSWHCPFSQKFLVYDILTISVKVIHSGIVK